MKNSKKLLFLPLFFLLSLYINLSADTEPTNDTCDGVETLATIVSGTNTFTGTIESEKNNLGIIGIDYYRMEIPRDGNVTIKWETLQTGKKASFLLGSSCDANDYYNGSTALDTHTSPSISVVTNDVIYLKVYNSNSDRESYNLIIEYDIAPIAGQHLDLAIEDSDDPVDVNEPFYYIIDVLNSGTNTAVGVELTSTLDSGVIFDINTTNNNTTLWECTQSGQTVTCEDTSNIDSGDTHSLNLYVNAPSSPGFITNNISVIDGSSTATDSATETTLIIEEIPNANNLCYIENTLLSGLNADINTSCEKYGTYYYGQNCIAQIIIKEGNTTTDTITNLYVTKMYRPELKGTDANASSSAGYVLNEGGKSTLAIPVYPDYEEGYVVFLDSNLTDDANFTLTDQGSYYNQPFTGIGIYADYNTSAYTHHFGRVYACDGTGEFDIFTTIKDVDFNMVNNYFYPYTDGNKYYNLPTQITKRADNFKVIALQQGTTSLKEVNGTILLDVELVDGDSSSDCATMTPLNNLIVDVALTNTNETDFNATIIDNNIQDPSISEANKLFYEKAAKNAYFRISYVTNEANGIITFEETSPGSGSFHLPGFEDYAGTLCQNEFNDYKYNPDGTVQSYDYNYKLVSVACANAGISSSSGMSQNEVDICTKCLFGGNNVKTCSKDNFAIRPEAFRFTLKDQNQTSSTSKTTLGNNVAGTMPINLAADYNYNIEVNATDHYSDANSSNYNTSTETLNLIWEPRGGHIVSGCNAPSDNNSTFITFVNGRADLNITHNNVGEYRLNITDNSWSAVDKVIHTASGFYINGTNITDCVENSSNTHLVSSGGLNGCDVSSSHTNPQTTTVFKDYNITFHPYKFDLAGITPSVGLNSDSISTNNYIYMADLSSDENMSYHLNGFITPKGYNDSNLSNFVDGCYAKSIDINISRTMDTINGLAYQYRFKDINLSGAVASVTSGDLNNSNGPITISEGNFTTPLNGSINSQLHLNFARTKNQNANPREVRFITYNVNCTNPNTDCSFSADLSTKTTQGEKALDHNVTHFYGRTHATRQRYTNNSGTANIYYEIYCFGSDDFNQTCNKALVSPHNSSFDRTDDIRWFLNNDHNSSYGVAGVVTQKSGTGVSATTPTNANPSQTTLTYDESYGYPYKTTMENNASNWLIQNDSNPNATKNSFPVEFIKLGDWSGEHQTDTTTNEPVNLNTNRRVLW